MRKSSVVQCLSLILITATLTLADEWKKNFTVSGQADLRIDVTDREVTVHAWERNEINARVTTEGWKIAPSEVRGTARQAGSRIDRHVRTSRRNNSLRRDS